MVSRASIGSPGGAGTASGRTVMEKIAWVLRKPQFWFAICVLVPTFLWYGVFSFRPIFQALPLALKKYKLLNPGASKYVGLDNFVQLITRPMFLIAVMNTFKWALVSFAVNLPLTLYISFCLANVVRGRNLYQSLIFLPVVVSLVAIALLFRMLMDPQVGQLNRLLRSVGLPESEWLSGSSTALMTCIFILTWKGMGGTIVIITAGMMGIPRELYDAARVDGVNEWQRFWKITLPLMAHTLLLVTVLMAIGSLQEFTAPTVLTNGGPGNTTYLYNMMIYGEAFQQMRFGMASAGALMMFVVIMVITLLQIKLLRPNWSY